MQDLVGIGNIRVSFDINWPLYVDENWTLLGQSGPGEIAESHRYAR